MHKLITCVSTCGVPLNKAGLRGRLGACCGFMLWSPRLKDNLRLEGGPTAAGEDTEEK